MMELFQNGAKRYWNFIKMHKNDTKMTPKWCLGGPRELRRGNGMVKDTSGAVLDQFWSFLGVTFGAKNEPFSKWFLACFLRSTLISILLIWGVQFEWLFDVFGCPKIHRNLDFKKDTKVIDFQLIADRKPYEFIAIYSVLCKWELWWRFQLSSRKRA